MTWVHWVLYNLPPSSTHLAEGVRSPSLPSGTKEGLNDWKRTGYGGPCPPIGRHRYFHKLFALDLVLRDLGIPTKARLEEAMAGHILAETLKEIRKAGFAHSRSELIEGAEGVAAPIFDRMKAIVAALVIAGPEQRFRQKNLDEIVDMVKDSAANISKAVQI